MSRLFESSKINGMQLSNRFVRSATWEGIATEDGAVTPRLIKLMTELAAGGVGLTITGHAYVQPEGQADPWQLGIYKDELIPGLKEMSTAVHEAGGKIVMQLAHAGQFAAEKLIGGPRLVVSDYKGLAKSAQREISTGDIREIVTAFADAAGRAKAAGFDGVQIHSAHGYLLSQFLSPIFNRRRDEYGGSVVNRARIHLEIYHAMREAVGASFPVMIKMNCRDSMNKGLSLDESVQAAGLLANAGLDAIEVSGGIRADGQAGSTRTGIDSREKEAYFSEELRAFRKAIHIPLILVGGIRSFEVAQGLVQDGLADYISMCRPFIKEPDLINRWKAGDLSRAKCLSDNLCYKAGHEGKGVYCVARKGEKAKQIICSELTPSEQSK